jgi:hypothetical protein
MVLSMRSPRFGGRRYGAPVCSAPPEANSLILLQSRTLLQALILAIVVAGLAWLVVTNSTGWADWVVFGVIVLTTVGAARAIYTRRYPTRKRTFVRHSEPPQKP